MVVYYFSFTKGTRQIGIAPLEDGDALPAMNDVAWWIVPGTLPLD